MAELHRLAIEYQCPIANIIHVNPGSENGKTRGHLGSQLERKSETNLRLEKDAQGVTVMWADKNRRAPIPKSTAPRFIWSGEAGMHLSIGRGQSFKEEAKMQEMRTEAEAVFTVASNSAISYGQFIQFLVGEVHISKSTAKRRLIEMIRTRIIRKEPTGLYALAKT